MPAKRVLITGVGTFLGAAVARSLRESGEVSHVTGVDVVEPSFDVADMEFIRADIRTPLVRKVLASADVDAVVHTALVSQSRLGGRSAQKERNVIGTLQLLAACQKIEGLRKVVVRSSTAVYGIEPGGPSILRESASVEGEPLSGYSRDLVEAETYARDFGRRRPDVSLTILRMTNTVGPEGMSNMSQFFSLPFIPTPLGYDPRLQLVHEDDAIEVLKRAVLEDHPGVFNVAADGVMYLSQAVRLARRLPLPIAAPIAPVVAGVLRRSGVVDFPSDQMNLIVHGRVVDNQRLKEIFGYRPRYSTLEAFRDFLSSSEARSSNAVTDWERWIYETLAGAAASRRRMQPTGPRAIGNA